MSLNLRLNSSRIWKMEQGICRDIRGYRHTLDTVWNLAFQRLSKDTAKLLEYIAFLDPDEIPVDLFVGVTENSHSHDEQMDWQYWDRHR